MSTLTPMTLEGVLAPLPDDAGPIGLLSSDEFTWESEAFDVQMLAAARGRRVALVVAAAGADAPNAARHGMEHYRRLGAKPFVVEVTQRHEAVAEALPEFDVLFMCGGSPRTLLRCLLRSTLWKEALRRWRSGAMLAGSSAGAMALCTHTLIPGPGDRMPMRWTTGLGPITTAAMAVHASSRRNEWLERIRADAPVPIVALDDATGVILNADTVTVAGPGKVRVLA